MTQRYSTFKASLMLGVFCVFLMSSASVSAQSETMNENLDEMGEISLDDVIADLPSDDDLTPSVSNNAENEPDVFFDSNDARSPTTVLQDVAPVKVDPREAQGQSFIIVKKNSGAGSYEAQVVAANRALKLGRDAAALDVFERLYKQNPRDVRILMGLAVAQQKSGLTASAIQTYEELLKRDPNNAEAVVNMLGLLQRQYPEVALRRLLDLRDSNPQNSGIAAQIGMAQANLGQYKDALRFLEIANSLDPQSAVHLYNMAVVTDKLGRNTKAIELYEETLQVDAMYGSSRSVSREAIYDRLATLRRM